MAQKLIEEDALNKLCPFKKTTNQIPVSFEKCEGSKCMAWTEYAGIWYYCGMMK